MPKQLSPELKKALAELLEEEDEETTEEAPEGEDDGEEADEFVYRGKRYVYAPEDIAKAKNDAKEEQPEEPAAPKKRPRRFVT